MIVNERGQIGLVGEYAVLSTLILNGFAAARADGDLKDIDILCSTPNNPAFKKIQVKTQGPKVSYYFHSQAATPHYAFHTTSRL